MQIEIHILKINEKYNAQVDAATQKAQQEQKYAAEKIIVTSNRQAVDEQFRQMWEKQQQDNAITEAKNKAAEKAEAQKQQNYVADLAKKSVENLVETKNFDLAENIAYMKTKISKLNSSNFNKGEELADLN